jgi:hypothetical protein
MAARLRASIAALVTTSLGSSGPFNGNRKSDFTPPRQRAFVSRASNIHVRSGADVIEMSEPSAADRTLP